MALCLRRPPRPAINCLRFAIVVQSRARHSKPERRSRPLSTFSVTSLEQARLPEPPTFSLMQPHTKSSPEPPLSILPLSSILRSITILTASSSPPLLALSLQALKILAHPPLSIFDTNKNPLLRWFVKRTVYPQFCAGENAVEISNTVRELRELGYEGVMLSYAKEKEIDKYAKYSLEELKESPEDIEDIQSWRDGNIQTIALAQEGDFAALKFTGAGNLALRTMAAGQPCTPTLQEALTSICDLAASRGVRLLIDAEHAAIQHGIDKCTLSLMKTYNRLSTSPVVYGTYQAYLKITPQVLTSHLAAAQADDFNLGIKLVRGAYLGSDPRELICDTKADTDAQFDGITAALLQKSPNSVMPMATLLSGPAEAGAKAFPKFSLVLASHNQDSVRAAQRIRDQQAKLGLPSADLIYAQLMGMADEVSCELLAEKQYSTQVKSAGNVQPPPPAVYKYFAWGTTEECMQYLLRRAQENQDAVARTRIGRDAMLAELWRRLKRGVGFGLP